MTKFAEKSFSTPANSQQFRDNFDRVFGKVLRCEVTKNPCGTDTRPAGVPCPCESCQAWETSQLPQR